MVGKNSTKKKAWMLLMVLVLVLLVLLPVIYLSDNTQKEDNILTKVETDFCDLYYPSQWKKYMNVRQENDMVTFVAKIKGHEIKPLFDIYFGSDKGTYLGGIIDPDGNEVSVSFRVYLHEQYTDWTEEEMDILYEMQEGINDLIDKLPLVEAEMGNEHFEDLEPVDMEILTSYGKLKYPEKWKPYLRLNIRDEDQCVVEFYAQVGKHLEVHLFNVLLGNNQTGELVVHRNDGTVCSLDLEFLVGELDATWLDQEADIIYGMLDDANYLLESFAVDADND